MPGHLHCIFLPFRTQNCVAIPSGMINWLASWVMDVGQTNWADQMLGHDKQAIGSCTLDHYYEIGERKNGTYTSAERTGPNAYIEILKDAGKSFGVSDSLYVVGHCGPGEENLYSPNSKESCGVDQLAAYLSHLPKDFKGKLKVHGCSSAAAGWLPQNQSFAKRLFDKMTTDGYQNLALYGYTNTIVTWHTSMADGSWHKHRTTYYGLGYYPRNSESSVKIQ